MGKGAEGGGYGNRDENGGNVTSEQTWLGELLRDESLMNVTEVGLGGRSITDAGLADLEALSQLQRLDLYDTQVSDAGLEHLQGLSQLLSLSLAGTEVTDAGLTHLQRVEAPAILRTLRYPSH